MLIILSISGVCIVIFIHDSQGNLEELVRTEVASMRAVVQIVEEENSRNYRRRIQSFINYTDVPKREELVVAFARRDREKLLQLTIPYLEESPQFATLVWAAPGCHIFLRVHNPSLFGNDTSKKRPDIVDANREQHQHAAYKVSGPGLLFNVVQPVSYKGEHLGILQFGLKETPLLEILHEKLNHSVGLAIPNTKYSFICNSQLPFLAGKSHTIQSNQLDLFQEDIGVIDWTLDQQKINLYHSQCIKLPELQA